MLGYASLILLQPYKSHINPNLLRRPFSLMMFHILRLFGLIPLSFRFTMLFLHRSPLVPSRAIILCVLLYLYFYTGVQFPISLFYNCLAVVCNLT